MDQSLHIKKCKNNFCKYPLLRRFHCFNTKQQNSYHSILNATKKCSKLFAPTIAIAVANWPLCLEIKCNIVSMQQVPIMHNNFNSHQTACPNFSVEVLVRCEMKANWPILLRLHLSYVGFGWSLKNSKLHVKIQQFPRLLSKFKNWPIQTPQNLRQSSSVRV